MPECKFCGKTFEAKRVRNKADINPNTLCSKLCQCRYARSKSTSHLNRPPKDRICKKCGKTFHYRNSSYCSNECSTPTNKTCEDCGQPSGSKKYCKPCRMERNRRSAKTYYVPTPTNHICSECDTPFISSSRTIFCSDKCKTKSNNRKGDKRRDALIRQAFVEDVGLTYLIHRDLEVCGICGELVDVRMQVPHPWAPTIDHIIPLSKGGKHSKSNCQLAHFWCNCVVKSDTMPAGHILVQIE